MADRVSSLDLVLAIAGVYEALPRAGTIVTNVEWSSRIDSPEKRYGFLRDLVDGNGTVVEAAGQDPRLRTGHGSSGNERFLVTHLTDFLDKPHEVPGEDDPDPSSFIFFSRKNHEAEVEFEKQAHARLGITVGTVDLRTMYTPNGPFIASIDRGEPVHVNEYLIEVFTGTC